MGCLTLALGVGMIAASPRSSVAAVSDQVLILADTVTGGVSSIEASEVAAKGLTPIVVDDSTWAGMTTAQFASYRAIVLGDPTCGGTAPAAAAANASTWGAAVSGNVVIVGTDAVFHASQGGEALTRRGVDFAIDQPEKTGAYVTLSCYYHDTAAKTPVPMLDAFRPDGFTVTGVGCYNDAHVVATHPALEGLTDAELSNWSCSVHEAFDTWPADFTVLAIAKDFGASYTGSDGTVGTPYILARGSGLRSFPLSLEPTSSSAILGTPKTVTATLLDGTTRAPVPDSLLGFRVTSGPDVGTVGSCAPFTCRTDGSGQVRWTLIGSGIGDDEVQVFVDRNANGAPDLGEPQTTALVRWELPAGQTYVAMGDSFSSGEGVPPYEPETEDNGCHRSLRSYSRLVAPRLGYLPRYVACSGAIVANLYLGQNGEASQLDALSNKTSLVTLTVGGNDTGFPDVLDHCIRGPGHSDGDCRSYAGPLIDNALDHLENGYRFCPPGEPSSLCVRIPSLHNLYARIHELAPTARIYVLNYPSIFNDKAKRNCGTGFGSGVTADNQRWLARQGERLNEVIRRQVTAAKKARLPITLVDVAKHFRGHELCGKLDDPWFNDVKLTVSLPPKVKPESFHPNQRGQAEMAFTLRRALGLR
jgi:hypothetical protein